MFNLPVLTTNGKIVLKKYLLDGSYHTNKQKTSYKKPTPKYVFDRIRKKRCKKIKKSPDPYKKVHSNSTKYDSSDFLIKHNKTHESRAISEDDRTDL